MTGRDAGRPGRPLIAIAWDAAEPSLVESWMADGSLPNLHQLREEGGYRRLHSSAALLAGSPWPTFFTATPPEAHGIYHYLQWCAESGTLRRPGPDWLPVRPFWRDLSEAGRRVLIVDVPMTPPPERLWGVEISGWSSHDRLEPPASYPPEVIQGIVNEFGECPLGDEIFGCTGVRTALATRDEMIASTRRLADLTTAWLGRGGWDFVLAAFGATHRGGHHLWDLSGVRDRTIPGHEAAFSSALKDVYMACDEALGRIRAAAPVGASIAVFSLHGMGPNTSRVPVLPEMLARVLASSAERQLQPGLEWIAHLVLDPVPVEWRHQAKKRLPRFVKDWLTERWYMGASNVSTMQAFSVVADLQGYIRVNLRGREPNGLVERGAELDSLCDRITQGLQSFVDADTREPVVRDVVRTHDACADADRRQHLPDLVVQWAESSAAGHRAIESAEFGRIPWPIPGRQPDGRSGNHRGEGFVAGLGGQGPRAEITDLAPTFLSWLAVQPPEGMTGRSLVPLGAGKQNG